MRREGPGYLGGVGESHLDTALIYQRKANFTHHARYYRRLNCSIEHHELHSNCPSVLQPIHVRLAIRVQSIQGESTQGSWERLPGLEGAGNGRAGEDDGCEEGELDAVGQVGSNAVTAKGIL